MECCNTAELHEARLRVVGILTAFIHEMIFLDVTCANNGNVVVHLEGVHVQGAPTTLICTTLSR